MTTHLYNEADKLEYTVGVEGRLSREQLIQDASQCPQVGGVVIRLLLHKLRGHVQWCALGKHA